MLLFLQVGVFYRYKRTRVIPKSVPEPTGPLKRFFAFFVLELSCVLSVLKSRLLLAGDVEENPGPLSKELEQELMKTLRDLPKMLESQDMLTKEFDALKTQNEMLIKKIAELETKIDKLVGSPPSAPHVESEEIRTQSDQLADAMRKVFRTQDDIENRSRRNNLLFFGVEGEEKETWDESEAKVISLCAEKLQVTVTPSSIERAHRMGKPKDDNPRPIIVKFALFKDKQRVLSAASKLKGTKISIGEDYSRNIRQEREKLIAFARERGAKIKLRYNKLTLDGKTYSYDSTSDSVRECAQ